MKSFRMLLNAVSLVLIFGLAPLAFAPKKALASGGTCCLASNKLCFLNLDGRLIRQPGAYYCEPQ